MGIWNSTCKFPIDTAICFYREPIFSWQRTTNCWRQNEDWWTLSVFTIQTLAAKSFAFGRRNSNTPKVSYDPSTNQLVAFTFPLDSNGMSKSFSFLARNVKKIQKHFTDTSNFITSTAFAQMARDPDSAPFCLMLFLTDNTFTAHNILKRWKFQATELEKVFHLTAMQDL